MTEGTLGELLDPLTIEGELYEALPGGAVRCYACGHRCLIREGRRGICKVRFNQEGRLRVPFGYVGALQSDPTEKKPFFHLLPGSDTLTFGMLGCDFHCGYCQNWVTSQAMRDPASDVAAGGVRQVSPDDLVNYGLRAGAQVVGSSYNEPLITSEWARSVFERAKQAGLLCVYISNGNATQEVLEYLKPHVVGYKIDLKTMNDKAYRSLGGVLDHVLESVAMVHAMGFWLEVVTLVVPGFNDSTEELMSAARFLSSISPDIPWHVTAFHKDYKMTEPEDTTAQMLVRAAEIGQEAGLNYVYAGNLPGRVGDYEHTMCPQCREKVVQRIGYVILDYRLTGEGKCARCGAGIPGVWPEDPAQVRVGQAEDLYFRRPRAVR